MSVNKAPLPLASLVDSLEVVVFAWLKVGGGGGPGGGGGGIGILLVFPGMVTITSVSAAAFLLRKALWLIRESCLQQH